jgi:hypothetical protein
MQEQLRQARHNLRGRLNALKLCVSALEMLRTRAELLEFLDMIDQAADRTVVAMDTFDAVVDRGVSQGKPD